MAKIKSPRKTAQRAQQTAAKTAKKLRQSASKGHRTASATAPARAPAKATDFDPRFAYDCKQLPTGFLLFVADDAGRGHATYTTAPAASFRALCKSTDARLRITGLHPASEFAADLVCDKLISDRLPGPSGLWYRRSETAMELERSALTVMARELRRALDQDRRAEAKRLQDEVRRIIAPHVKAHNAFMANLAKHTKALTALAR